MTKPPMIKLAAAALGAAVINTAVMTTSASGTLYYFTNAAADNDFANLANWNTDSAGAGSVPGAINTDDVLQIDRTNSDYAELSTSLGYQWANIQIGHSSGVTGELRITGGTHTILDVFRAGRLGGAAVFTMSGGVLNTLNSFTTLGDGGAGVTATMTGGYWNCDRQTWGQQATDVVNFNMSGGTINLAQSDTTPPGTTGSLRMGLGDTHINVTGSAVINAQKLHIREGGVLTIDGGTVNITGAIDSNPTFNWLEANLGSGNTSLDMYGEIDYRSGQFNVTGNYESLFDACITHGNVYTTSFGYKIDAVYNAGADMTTLALIALQPGDANDDGMVNLADLQILGDNWQSTTAGWSQADFTGDGVVNLADLQIIGDNWGVGPDVSFDEALATVAIPEPAALALLGLALPLILRGRQG